MPVNLRDPANPENVYTFNDDEAATLIQQGWAPETTQGQVERVTGERLEDEYGGAAGKVAAAGAGVLRGATLGLSDATYSALGAGDDLRRLREVNPGTSLATEIVGGIGGSFVGGLPAGIAERAGASIARAGEGASVATRAGRLAAGGALEGGVQGVGDTISQVALSEDPLSIEQIGSSLLSNIGANALVGGGANVAGMAAGAALRKAKGKLDEIAARGVTNADNVSADLAKLDAKGLRAAEKAELDAIEQARVPQRAQIADEIKAHRATDKNDKLFLATKDAKAWEGIDEGLRKEVREVGKVSFEADKTIDRALRNPKALASNPRRALDALQQQESALETLISKRAQLEDVFRADASGARMAALDAAERSLQRNKDIQSKIAGLSAAPSSPRLEQVRDALAGGAPKESFLGKAAAGAAFSGAAGLAYESGLPGAQYLAPLVGAAAANAISGKLGAKMASASAEAAKRASSAVDMFLKVGQRIAPAAPVLATKVLAAAKYATTDEKPRRGERPARTASLPDAYKARSEEIKAQTSYVNGVPKMRPEARQRVAAQLAPIGVASPILADRLETLAARKVEYLSSKLPRRPDIAGIPTGPDRWQPSDMEMRSFARTMAAVEDPHGVIERLADGSITPEDAEVMREVYPEMMADVTRQILERLPELREQLPYERRLALSIFTGAPVDPAMDPGVLRVLQGSFTEEPGTEGGMQAPKPIPAFGSVKNHEATPSQQRQGELS